MDPDEFTKMCESIFSHTPKENQLQTINSYYGGKDTIFVATGYGTPIWNCLETAAVEQALILLMTRSLLAALFSSHHILGR